MKKEKRQRRGKRRSKIYSVQQYEHLNWIFPPEPPLLPGEHGLPKDHYNHPHDTEYESICGGMDESQDVELYDGTLGVTVGFVQSHERPVGQLQWNNNLADLYDNPGNVNGIRWCTGTLISQNLFLTAGHCFDTNPLGWVVPRQNGTALPIPSGEIATNMHVNFNYQFAPDGTLRVEESFPVLDLVEYRLGGLDFAIVRLGGNPGSTYGFEGISDVDADVADMLCVIQHPAGVPKRIDAGPLYHFHDVRLGYDSIDTLGGSSGSGIIRESTGLIVGVHTNGGCSPAAGSHNHGVRITSIISNSPTIQGILHPKFKFADDPIKFRVDDPKFKFSDDIATLKTVDDGPTLKFRDDIGTLKTIDDGPSTLKFKDDITTLKTVDDGPTLKFRDDIGTLKTIDDGPTTKFSDDPGTLKQVDDVKNPSYDKNPAVDNPGNFGPNTLQEGTGSPFILSTPHHSNVWASSFPDAFKAKIQEYEQIIPQYESEIRRLDELHKANRLDENSEKQFEKIVAEYQQLIAEYQQLIQK